MSFLSVTFDAPAYLWLLALLPGLWWMSYRSLAGLGRVRRVVALALRSLVLALLIVALAEIQFVKTTDRLTVIFIVDQSLSIPPDQRSAMIDYVQKASGRQRRTDSRDRAGLIAVGRDVAVVTPPVEESVPVGGKQLEVALDPEFTNLAAAMRLAHALFPEDGAKRIVIVTDGNENLGDAAQYAQTLAEAGIGIDVVPVRLGSRADVTVEKIATSTDVRRGQPFNLRVVLDAQSPDGKTEIAGSLRIVRKTGDEEHLLNPDPASQRVKLSPGKNVFTFRETIDQPDFYRYEARFVPDDPRDDAVAKNNQVTTFTHVRGRGQVLLIRDWQREVKDAAEFDMLVERLRKENIKVTVRTSDRLFEDLADLQRYDSVVLANVPRTSGGDDGNLTHFTDEQIAMLVHNTQQLGAGLVMIGGANSFGAGGWAGTDLEKAMPVDFTIQNAKVKAVGALAMIMHASEIAQGNYWQKRIAQEAIKTLGPEDYCGVIHWDGNDQWLWDHARGGMSKVGGDNRQRMLAFLDRMTPGDMPHFDPAMQLAAGSLRRLSDAAVKHIIIISDGDPSPSSQSTLNQCVNSGIKITTVAVDAHDQAGSNELRRIATQTGGKYYVAKDARALPKIYQREVRRIARSLVYEREDGIRPLVAARHEMLKGIDSAPPPITGFVLTTVKEQAEVVLTSPEPAGDRNNTLLAGWVYGLGKTVVLTTDAGDRWATSWAKWDSYNKLFSQIVRWSMRPSGDERDYSVSTDVKDGKARVVVTALDAQNRLVNLLDMSATVIGPDLKPKTIKIAQTAPGRYVGEFDAQDAGSYLLSVIPSAGKAAIRTGVNVSYSPEFRDRATNQGLLAKLVSVVPTGGERGVLIGEGLESNVADDGAAGDGASGGIASGSIAAGGRIDALLAVDTFRHTLARSNSRQPIWHLAAMAAACLFFFDVFVRRVAVDFAWAPPLLVAARNKVLRRAPAPAAPEYIDRLRSLKAEVSGHLEQRRAAARFETPPDADTSAAVLDGELDSPPAAAPRIKKPERPGLGPAADAEGDEYTSRLLKAKRQARDQRKDET